MKSIVLASVFALAVSTGGAFAASAWDANGDGMIDADEYATGMNEAEAFHAYDADGDGAISREEFAAATWRIYDEDGDGMWNETELGAWQDSAMRSGAEVSK